MKFSDNLRNLRVKRGLTQMQLAEGLNTSQSAITSWELAKREPDFKTIQRIADFFGVSVSSLLPSSDTLDADYVLRVSESLNSSPKLAELFNKAKYLSDFDLDTVLAVVSAITKGRE